VCGKVPVIRQAGNIRHQLFGWKGGDIRAQTGIIEDGPAVQPQPVIGRQAASEVIVLVRCHVYPPKAYYSGYYYTGNNISLSCHSGASPRRRPGRNPELIRLDTGSSPA
jgi:hypothetical protein